MASTPSAQRVHTIRISAADDPLVQSDESTWSEPSMNEKGILKLVAVVALAKLVIGSHHHRMGTRNHGNWHDRIAELHRELHRSDAEAESQSAATPAADAT